MTQAHGPSPDGRDDRGTSGPFGELDLGRQGLGHVQAVLLSINVSGAVSREATKFEQPGIGQILRGIRSA